MKEKNLELERLVFFSDAIVAIAITLLVFDLKLNHITDGHITFADLANSWQKFAAFILSFFIIAIFWKIHHEFYTHIRQINGTLLWINIGWLMFIVTIPFSTSLISAHFFDKPAIFTYSLNVLIVTIFQNTIWDYVAARPEFLKENENKDLITDFRIACNLAMANALIACALSFISPVAAFIILVTRLPLFTLSAKNFKRRTFLKMLSRRRKKSAHENENLK
ncbi:MAG TPA: TMEM175 family protein [Puia sp.]|nr:TMEM175 family protein [Puia sp.]